MYYFVIARLPVKQCWYLAGVAQEADDWHEYTPKETVLSELSYWTD
jgi:hypothetical protein